MKIFRFGIAVNGRYSDSNGKIGGNCYNNPGYLVYISSSIVEVICHTQQYISYRCKFWRLSIVLVVVNVFVYPPYNPAHAAVEFIVINFCKLLLLWLLYFPSLIQGSKKKLSILRFANDSWVWSPKQTCASWFCIFCMNRFCT